MSAYPKNLPRLTVPHFQGFNIHGNIRIDETRLLKAQTLKKMGILTNDVVAFCPTKFLIFASTSVFYVSMSVNYENQGLVHYCRQSCNSNYGFFARTE
jgi:hypothetical protein